MSFYGGINLFASEVNVYFVHSFNSLVSTFIRFRLHSHICLCALLWYLLGFMLKSFWCCNVKLGANMQPEVTFDSIVNVMKNFLFRILSSSTLVGINLHIFCCFCCCLL